jgi:hypothetical protein
MLTHFMNRLETADRDGPHRISKFSVAPLGNLPRDGPARIIPAVEMLDVSPADEAQLRERITNEILKNFSFPSMNLRYEDLGEAYPETFEWALRKPKLCRYEDHIKAYPNTFNRVLCEPTAQQSFAWSNFVDWLRTGQGTYWINGKAGSGKSTLMKHILDHPDIHPHLTAWAEEMNICMAYFFFWNSGSQHQRSHHGLLRSIILQILQQAPEITPIVLPELWAKSYSDTLCQISRQPEAWSLRDLRALFIRIVSQSIVPIKIFLLIDGLDESEGDHEDLIDLFAESVKSKNVKICLSSRPWVVFDDRFGQGPNLRLQELTHGDIEHYVKSKFHDNQAFQRMNAQEPWLAHILIHEIVERADGVFLWVHLVVKSLLDGIRNRDNVQVLLKRLRRLPGELEPLYKHILNQINPVYLKWASKALQLVRASFEPRSRLNAPARNKTLSIIQLYLALSKESYLVNLKLPEAEAGCEGMLVHLKARCAGLLEVPNFARLGIQAPVQYLHDTVRSFLEREEYWQGILAYTAKRGFNSHLHLMKSYVLSMWIDMNGKYGLSKLTRAELASCSMIHAHFADMHCKFEVQQVELLDKLDKIMLLSGSPSWKGLRFHWSHYVLGLGDTLQLQSFLSCATVYGLTGYVETKILARPSASISPLASSLLHHLLRARSANDEIFVPRIEMVSLLLQLGANPNWENQGNSTWTNLLQYIAKKTSTPINRNLPLPLHAYITFIKPLLESGADPQIRITSLVDEDRLLSVPEVVTESITPRFPAEGAAIRTELDRHIQPPDLDVLETELGMKRRRRRRAPDMSLTTPAAPEIQHPKAEAISHPDTGSDPHKLLLQHQCMLLLLWLAFYVVLTESRINNIQHALYAK